MALPFGVQALWYEGVGQCARVGTTKFELLSSINTRLAQWVTPVFLKQYATGSPPYRIDGIWSTATALTIPNASAPGRAESDVVQQMSPDLVVFLLRNTTKVTTPETLLYVVSASLSQNDVDTDTARQVSLRLRGDVLYTRPMEGGDAVPDCQMGLLRTLTPLKLIGGSAQ